MRSLSTKSGRRTDRSNSPLTRSAVYTRYSPLVASKLDGFVPRTVSTFCSKLISTWPGSTPGSSTLIR
jgi:hypothetical protein